MDNNLTLYRRKQTADKAIIAKQAESAEDKNTLRWDEVYGSGWLSLFGGIVRQAIEDLDHHDDEIRASAVEFFFGENFEAWCEIVNISSGYVRKLASVPPFAWAPLGADAFGEKT